ncbi:sialic acid-binding Ig-like lectin 6 [Orycteropus afer afer]|uniref:Sialic acid-binding Ig-like lectin 6 n=1 Tax=Orycteropus afer afer TaxID=1230840 RepID=A0AC54ZDX4_ORYAF|nr:sialic acid-binding Ig-like lectin 6 [Orycteropus afer afer]
MPPPPPLLLLPLLWGGSLTQNWAIQLELQGPVMVQEGLCVLVPCSVDFSVSYVYWFRRGAKINSDHLVATNKPGKKLEERTQGRFFLLGKPWSNNCTLRIRDVNKADSGTYFIALETYGYMYSYVDKAFSLEVTALTQSPDVQILGTLESGHPENLTCSVPWACVQGTPPIFSWNSAALTSLGPRTHLSSVLTVSPRPRDHGTSLTCQVFFPAVNVAVERTIQLNVSYAPQDLTISVFQGENTALKILENASSLTILEGQSLCLQCAADSKPHASLQWFRGFPTPNAAPISNTGYIELTQVGTGEEGVFTCQAQNQLGSQLALLNLSIHWKAEPGSGAEALGAVGGVVMIALLCLSVFLMFRVKKTQRKEAPGTMEGMNDTNLVLESGPWGHRHKFQRVFPSDHPASAGAGPISGEEPELHYASLNFHKLKLQEQNSTSTDYSEIKIMRSS